MRNIIFFIALFSSVTTYCQKPNKENRLQKTLREIHRALTNANAEFQPNFKYYGAEEVYINRGDSIELVAIDSLINLNYLDYDIKVVYDKTDIPYSKYYQGVIILTPTSEERRKVFYEAIMDAKRKKRL